MISDLAAYCTSQRDWLIENRPRDVIGAFNTEAFMRAARDGRDSVVLEAYGASLELDLVRFRQDMLRPVADEFRHVQCPALVLHGGSDMNVRVEDCLSTYRALKDAGNDDVELAIVPGVDHSFQPIARDPRQRVWDRLSLATMARPVPPRPPRGRPRAAHRGSRRPLPRSRRARRRHGGTPRRPARTRTRRNPRSAALPRRQTLSRSPRHGVCPARRSGPS